MKNSKEARLIANRVVQLRTARKLSQEKLGEAAGLSRDAISRIERGDREPRFKTLFQLAAAFGMTLPELLTFDGDVKPRDEHDGRFARIARCLRGVDPWLAERIEAAVVALCTPTAGERHKPPPTSGHESPLEVLDRGRKPKGRRGKHGAQRGKK